MSGSKTRSPREHDRREGLVDLDRGRCPQSFMPVFARIALRRVDRAVEQVVGIGADDHVLQRCAPAASGRAPSPSPRVIHRIAAAPSEICEELPAVWMPPSAHGLERRERPRAWSRGCPGPRRRAACCPVGLPSSPSTGASIGRISRLKRPSSRARLGLLLRARARSGRPSSRVMPRFLAMRSAERELVRRRVPRPVGGQEEARAVHHVGAEADVAHHLDAAGDADVDAARP